MRRRFIQVVLVSTGILMLVLSVLPHHHHGDKIYFSTAEECSDACSSDHQTGSTSHHHSDSDTSCDLRQLFLFSGRDDHHNAGSNCACMDPHSDDYLTINLPVQLLHLVMAPLGDERPYKYPPLIEPLGSSIVGSLAALRAPPVSIA